MPTFVYHMLRRGLEVGEGVEGLKVIALGGVNLLVSAANWSTSEIGLT